MIYTLLMLLVLFAVFASLWLESFWSNTITLINVTLAAILAFNFFEWLAATFESFGEWFRTTTYLWDYLCLWLLFAVFYGILRTGTDFASRNRVKFKLPVEMAGRIVSSLLVAIVMLSFVITSLHVAPLPAAPFNGAFAHDPKGPTFLFFSPDHAFLNFLQFTSRGSLATSPAAGAVSSPYPEDAGRNVFDPRADFIPKYRQRRQNLSQEEGLRVHAD